MNRRVEYIEAKRCEPYHPLGLKTMCYNMYNSIYVESAPRNSPLNKLMTLSPKTGYRCDNPNVVDVGVDEIY